METNQLIVHVRRHPNNGKMTLIELGTLELSGIVTEADTEAIIARNDISKVTARPPPCPSSHGSFIDGLKQFKTPHALPCSRYFRVKAAALELIINDSVLLPPSDGNGSSGFNGFVDVDSMLKDSTRPNIIRTPSC